MLVDGELYLFLEVNSLAITTWPERFHLTSSFEQEEVWHVQEGWSSSSRNCLGLCAGLTQFGKFEITWLNGLPRSSIAWAEVFYGIHRDTNISLSPTSLLPWIQHVLLLHSDY